MASANIDFSAAAESSANSTSAMETEPTDQEIMMEVDAEVKARVKQARMNKLAQMDYSSKNVVDKTDGPSKNGLEYLKDPVYQDLLVQKAALEEEVRSLTEMLEELDKSIAEDEAVMPIIEAAMMEEVRVFLAMSPRYTKIRPGAQH